MIAVARSLNEHICEALACDGEAWNEVLAFHVPVRAAGPRQPQPSQVVVRALSLVWFLELRRTTWRTRPIYDLNISGPWDYLVAPCKNAACHVANVLEAVLF